MNAKASTDQSVMYYDRRVQWGILIPLTLFHIACIAAFFTFKWSSVVLVLVLWWLTGGLGICVGFHRLLTHGSFKTSRFMKYTLTILGCLANEGPPIVWVGTHRTHHRYADSPGDPHSPKEDFSWGHILWNLFFEQAGARSAAGDLMRDPVMVFIDKYFWVPQLILIPILYWFGGWSWIVWGIFVRSMFVLHCTCFVNSAAHRWGYRTYNTPDHSRNNWWVALLSFGEGWHNNHHAFQSSAAHGLRWWEFDPTYLTIRFLAMLGLVWDVKLPPAGGRLPVASAQD